MDLLARLYLVFDHILVSLRVIFGCFADPRQIGRWIHEPPVGRVHAFVHAFHDRLVFLAVPELDAHDLPHLFIGELEILRVSKHRVRVAHPSHHAALLAFRPFFHHLHPSGALAFVLSRRDSAREEQPQEQDRN
jgi:hypothetical protein